MAQNTLASGPMDDVVDGEEIIGKIQLFDEAEFVAQDGFVFAFGVFPDQLFKIVVCGETSGDHFFWISVFELIEIKIELLGQFGRIF